MTSLQGNKTRIKAHMASFWDIYLGLSPKRWSQTCPEQVANVSAAYCTENSSPQAYEFFHNSIHEHREKKYWVLQMTPHFLPFPFRSPGSANERILVIFAKGSKGRHMSGNWIWSFIDIDYTIFLKHHPTKWKLKQKYVFNASSWTLPSYKGV